MSMESPDCHPAHQLRLLYLGHHRDAFVHPRLDILGSTNACYIAPPGASPVTPDLSQVLDLGHVLGLGGEDHAFGLDGL